MRWSMVKQDDSKGIKLQWVEHRETEQGHTDEDVRTHNSVDQPLPAFPDAMKRLGAALAKLCGYGAKFADRFKATTINYSYGTDAEATITVYIQAKQEGWMGKVVGFNAPSFKLDEVTDDVGGILHDVEEAALQFRNGQRMQLTLSVGDTAGAEA